MNNEAAEKRRIAKRESVRIEGMDCPSCASKISSIVGAMPGVDSVNVVFAQARMQVAYNQAAVTLADIETKVRHLGFDTARQRLIARQRIFSSLGLRRLRPVRAGCRHR